MIVFKIEFVPPYCQILVVSEGVVETAVTTLFGPSELLLAPNELSNAAQTF